MIYRRIESPIEAVIFDMDGLMLDTENLAKKAFYIACDKLGCAIDTSIYNQLVGRNQQGCKQILESRFGHHFSYDKMMSMVETIITERISNEGIPRKPGIEPLLEFLERKNIKRAVGTSTVTNEAEKRLLIANLRRFFSIIIGGDVVNIGKPDPEVFLKAAAAMEIKPCNCLVLEDSEPGILAALSANMMSFMVPDLIKPSEKIQKNVNAIFPSLYDVLSYFTNNPTFFEN